MRYRSSNGPALACVGPSPDPGCSNAAARGRVVSFPYLGAISRQPPSPYLHRTRVWKAGPMAGSTTRNFYFGEGVWLLTVDPASFTFLQSQAGHAAGVWLTAIPSDEGHFLHGLRRRLRPRARVGPSSWSTGGSKWFVKLPGQKSKSSLNSGPCTPPPPGVRQMTDVDLTWSSSVRFGEAIVAGRSA